MKSIDRLESDPASSTEGCGVPPIVVMEDTDDLLLRLSPMLLAHKMLREVRTSNRTDARIAFLGTRDEKGERATRVRKRKKRSLPSV